MWLKKKKHVHIRVDTEFDLRVVGGEGDGRCDLRIGKSLKEKTIGPDVPVLLPRLAARC